MIDPICNIVSSKTGGIWSITEPKLNNCNIFNLSVVVANHSSSSIEQSHHSRMIRSEVYWDGDSDDRNRTLREASSRTDSILPYAASALEPVLATVSFPNQRSTSRQRGPLIHSFWDISRVGSMPINENPLVSSRMGLSNPETFDRSWALCDVTCQYWDYAAVQWRLRTSSLIRKSPTDECDRASALDGGINYELNEKKFYYW